MTYAANKDLLDEFSSYENFSFTNCDINDLEFLYDCDYVINTAAETHVGNSIVKSDDFVYSNINGVHKILELLRNYRQENNKTPILLHFSTDEVYGDIAEGSHTETDMLKPSNPYSATKAAADMLILAWARTYKTPYVIVRPTNNYGIGQYVEKLIPQDSANAVLTIIDSGVKNEIYNICGGFEQKNIQTVSNILSVYMDKPISEINIQEYVDFDLKRIGQDIRYALDDSKLRSLGWKPQMNFEKEIIDIVNHYREKFIW
jgi:dTDP-glucose 4,6-dehydratase